MQQIELIPGIQSSVLGFGCASVQGAVDAKTASIAINTALDLGINHFDLARSYGYGEAERFVGRILASRRDQVRIATKFGIYANWKAQLIRPLKPIYRVLKQRGSARHSGSQPSVPATSKSDRFHSRFELTPRNMLSSFHKSLIALQTDYVDYLFVHEPIDELREVEALIETANRLKQQGKIRAIGLATRHWNDTFAENYGSFFDVLQFAKPDDSDVDSMLNVRKNLPSIIYSVFRKTGHSKNVLKNLSLRLSKSVLLCSMFNPEHIAQNVAQVS